MHVFYRVKRLCILPQSIYNSDTCTCSWHSIFYPLVFILFVIFCQELLLHNPKPKKDQIIAVAPRDPEDLLLISVQLLMKRVEMATPLSDSLKPPRGSQPYENWIVQQKKDAEEKHKPDTDMIFGCQVLIELNRALMFLDELQGQDILELVLQCTANLPSEPTEVQEQVRREFECVAEDLMDAIEEEVIRDNPKLEQLTQLLADLFTANPESKGTNLKCTAIGINFLIHNGV